MKYCCNPVGAGDRKRECCQRDRWVVSNFRDWRWQIEIPLITPITFPSSNTPMRYSCTYMRRNSVAQVGEIMNLLMEARMRNLKPPFELLSFLLYILGFAMSVAFSAVPAQSSNRYRLTIAAVSFRISERSLIKTKACI